MRDDQTFHVTLTSTDWPTPQTVKVTGADDAVVEVDQVDAIVLGLDDATFDGVNPSCH